MIEQKEITPHVVLRVHEILMRNQKLEDRFKGNFRDCAVYIGNSECVNYAQIPYAIKDWCNQMNINATTVFIPKYIIEETSKELHVLYEKIHPFVDGNGRTGRIFMNWWRIKNGLPILVIHKGKEQHEYYKWFK
jgi:Fic family protein